MTDSPWSFIELREQRLALTLEMLKGQSFKLVIDETGDKKKGDHTDYVARQYIGNLGKVENGIVSVNAYGVLGDITFPLMFKIYKPKATLKEGDSYKTKPQLAASIIEELQKKGFKFDLVLADSLYGESSTFITVLNKYSLLYVVAIRSNHGGWLPTESVQGITGFLRMAPSSTDTSRKLDLVPEKLLPTGRLRLTRKSNQKIRLGMS